MTAMVIHGQQYRDPDATQFGGSEEEFIRERAERMLSAALPVLAESPELIERLARARFQRESAGMDLKGWGLTTDAVRESWRNRARADVRDLFAAAPTDTTEENTDG